MANSVLDRINERAATIDSLIKVEREAFVADSLEQDSIKKSKSFELGGYKPPEHLSTDVQELLEDLHLSTAEIKAEDIAENIGSIGTLGSDLKSEVDIYNEDLKIYNRVSQEIPFLEDSLSKLYDEVYSTWGEKLFGASDKEAEAKYNDGLRQLNYLKNIKKAVYTRWNVPLDYSSDIQSRYESFAGRGSGGMDYEDEVRDPERFNPIMVMRGQTYEPKSRFDTLHENINAYTLANTGLKSDIEEYITSYGEEGSDIKVMEEALNELKLQSLLRMNELSNAESINIRNY